MQTEENTYSEHRPTGVQHDSETPLPKKPSVLYIASVAIGIITIIALAASSYYGVAR